MRIAILGTGNIGGTIGKKWALLGHEIFFGSRNPQAAKVQAFLESIQGQAVVKSQSEAVSATGVVLLAIPAKAVEATVTDLAEHLDGKIIIDATNDFSRPTMSSLDLMHAQLPRARLFRAFNYLGWENFAEPEIGGEQADLFYCGEAGEAQGIIHGLIEDVGLRPIYIGNLDQAPLLDAMLRLWANLAMQQGRGRHLAFKLLEES